MDVIEGRLIFDCDGQRVVGEPGDLIAIERGATVVYSGTRAVFSLVPANWLEVDGE